MNKNIIKNIILSIILTTPFIFIVEDVSIENTIFMLVVGFLFLSFIDYATGYSAPKRITKEQDELLHPVTENTTILHICNIQKHYGKKYHDRFVEKCDCGSTLFRIYNEDTDKGTYIQLICAKCNQKATGLEFNWKVVSEERK